MISNDRPYKSFFPDIIDPSVTPFEIFIFGISAVLLLGIANFPPERFLSFFPQSSMPVKIIVDLRKYFFLFGLIVSFLPIFSCIGLYFKNDPKQIFIKLFKTFLWSVIICVILNFLAAPHWPFQMTEHILGIPQNFIAKNYLFMSQAPFEMNHEFFFRRLLMPALVYFFGFGRGFGFFVALCTFLLIWSLSIFIYTRIKIAGQVSSLFPFLLTLSLVSSSFVVICMQWPGYPDPLAFLLLLFPTLLPLSSLARLSLTTLALITHDGTFFILLPLVIFFYPKRELKGHLFLLAFFFAAWAISYHLNFKVALTAHEVIGPAEQVHRQAWLSRLPAIFFGIFTSFKLFWIFIPAALVLLKGPEGSTIRIGITAILIGTFIIVLYPFDTTRMANFGFLAILFSTVIILQNTFVQRFFLLPIVFLLTLNLLIPTYDSRNHDSHHKALIYAYSGAYKNIDRFLRIHCKMLPLSDPKFLWIGMRSNLRSPHLGSPNLAVPYYNLGNVYARHGYFTQAITDYTEAIRIDPNYADAYSNRAAVYYLLKEFDNAWDDVHRVESLGGGVSPDFRNALKNKLKEE